jgi:hypothetical protein
VCKSCVKILNKVEKLKEISIKSESFLRKQLAKKTSARTKSTEICTAAIKIETGEELENIHSLLLIPECEVKEEEEEEEGDAFVEVYSGPTDESIKFMEKNCKFSNQEAGVGEVEKVKRAAPRK